MALAMILAPLLFIKVFVARFYKNQHNLLMPIGLTIFVISFVLIASTAGPYLARPSKIERVSINPTVHAQPERVRQEVFGGVGGAPKQVAANRNGKRIHRGVRKVAKELPRP